VRRNSFEIANRLPSGSYDRLGRDACDLPADDLDVLLIAVRIFRGSEDRDKKVKLFGRFVFGNRKAPLGGGSSRAWGLGLRNVFYWSQPSRISIWRTVSFIDFSERFIWVIRRLTTAELLFGVVQNDERVGAVRGGGVRRAPCAVPKSGDR
jgi:hypothetical protein